MKVTKAGVKAMKKALAKSMLRQTALQTKSEIQYTLHDWLENGGLGEAIEEQTHMKVAEISSTPGKVTFFLCGEPGDVKMVEIAITVKPGGTRVLEGNKWSVKPTGGSR